MTEQQLKESMQQLARLQQEFIQAIRLLLKTIKSQETYIEAASKHLKPIRIHCTNTAS
jgi:hypothetical protein